MAYKSINPATGETVAAFADHTDEQINDAVTQAHAVYRSEWSQGPIHRRLQVLSRLADLVEARSEELARVAAQEMGKRISEARAEVAGIATIARYFADNAARMLAPHKVETDKGDASIEFQPIGVVVAIEPWNFPFYQLVRVAAPAIAAGNPVLVKPAGVVPQCAKLIEELILEAGAPRGVWTTVFASKDQIATLLQDDRVQGVTLTGSEQAGSTVAAEAGRNLRSRYWNSAARTSSPCSTTPISIARSRPARRHDWRTPGRSAPRRSVSLSMRRSPTGSSRSSQSGSARSESGIRWMKPSISDRSARWPRATAWPNRSARRSQRAPASAMVDVRSRAAEPISSRRS